MSSYASVTRTPAPAATRLRPRTGAGSISGTVTQDVAGTISDLANICVTVQTTGGVFGGIGTSTSNGSYSVTGLAAGGYTVWFSDCNNVGGYTSQYYDGATGGTSSYNAATTVNVTSGATSGIDAQMSLGGSISGTIYDSSGNPLAGVCASASSSGGGSSGAPPSGANGTYTIADLPAGSYVVQFTNCSSATDYTTLYYDSSALTGTTNFANASLVQVTNATASGIDAKMASGGSISGTITDA
ncbi:MAG TPA: carboxypeptidase-like regulatory domain-containing protein, partial [Acidimicrobiales bacterium]|nr:carboxypeptidase-like regulatory domain-containing protein [Acidimicrobiales bacterium]